MHGKVLIADSLSTNRIVLKTTLSSACYDVAIAQDGIELLRVVQSEKPRLVLLSTTLDDPEGRSAADLSKLLKSDDQTRDVPLIVLGAACTAQQSATQRMDALRAGAQAYFEKPVDGSVLLAQVRSLLRSHDITEELALRDTTSRDLGLATPISGFAEPETAYTAGAQIAIIARGPERAQHWAASLDEGTGKNQITALTPEKALTREIEGPDIDAYLIDAQLSTSSDGLQLMAELRSRSRSRNAVILIVTQQPVVCPAENASRSANPNLAAIALDMGAADVLVEPFTAEELTLRVNAQLAGKRQADKLRRQVRDGLRLAVIDPLTGLYNRRYAMNHLARVQERAADSGLNFAVMVLDLDRFKSVNDQFGHPAGDAVLRSVAQRLNSNLRGADLIARIGGEEFLVIMPETNAKEARAAAERLCNTVQSSPIKLPGTAGQMLTQTVSIGVAIGGGAGSKPAVCNAVERADTALLKAKARGRNMVRLGRNAA